jgi:hypothetical protein
MLRRYILAYEVQPGQKRWRTSDSVQVEGDVREHVNSGHDTRAVVSSGQTVGTLGDHAFSANMNDVKGGSSLHFQFPQLHNQFHELSGF